MKGISPKGAYVSKDAFFASLHGCLDLVETGHPGTPQDMLQTVGPGATPLSDQERTIRSDISVEEVLRLNRALDGSPIKPLIHVDGRLFCVVRISKAKTDYTCDDDQKHPVGFQRRFGPNIFQVFEGGGALNMAIRAI